jgi:hypothetical protein
MEQMPILEYENNIEAFMLLKREYYSLPTKKKKHDQYTIPYLNLFSKLSVIPSFHQYPPPLRPISRILVEIEGEFR